jgi:hypothetical protein
MKLHEYAVYLPRHVAFLEELPTHVTDLLACATNHDQYHLRHLFWHRTQDLMEP